jgi:hypothetical protein
VRVDGEIDVVDVERCHYQIILADDHRLGRGVADAARGEVGALLHDDGGEAVIPSSAGKPGKMSVGISTCMISPTQLTTRPWVEIDDGIV